MRSGHSQVDLDHLLIGLLVVDGGAERLLMAAGLRLGPARQAIAAQERADVRALGLDDALSGEPWAPPAPMKYTADLMPFTVAAKAVVKDCRRWRETDLRLLEQLVADPEAPGAESAEASRGRWRRHAGNGNGNGNGNGLGNVPSGAFVVGG
ncbi:MAG: Clp protease N-terminal domain-containing protein [Terracoccus sp.]